MGSQPVEFDEFAACLRALKDRAGLSYGALARRTRISSSSLHRYCSGSYVPQDYGSAHRFATACGASPEELRRLHRLWALADAARESGVEQDTGQDDTDQDDTDQGGAHGPDPDPVAAPPPASTPRPPWHRRTPHPLVMLALVLALGATAWGIAAVTGSGPTDDEERLLLSAKCAEPVSEGQRGTCVREAQRLLTRTGAELDVDGDFGPQTLRRVTAFQVLSRIGVNGVVDGETKRALYAPKVRMDSWAPAKVRQRVREVFRAVPDEAVDLADCQSRLDPLHVVPNTDGTRNWGLFQIPDAALRKLGGTPRDAMDPEWNIRAVHRLWTRTKNFGDLPHCDRATAPVPAPGEPDLIEASGGPPTAPPPDVSAPPASTTAVCPAPGQRFKMLTDLRIYLVGPGRRLYYVPDAVVYFNLWDDWNGVAVVSADVFAECGWDEARELADASLARTENDARTYLWDAWYGYRPIADRTAFDRYGFSKAKVRSRPSLSPVGADAMWR
ncbi:helix-turn-helix domain-containing protein [Streptomyces lincolnensis]|uniref:helix-turn-helix domain-containing protein n=1 Tax=Streptomyces lincolnensis TaxID=1915 RepID=UPI0037D1899E